MIDVTDATFERDVVERSFTVPVVVDLWAEWCQPCKTLGPVIEKAVAATGGKVELAKIDVDASPRISATFQVKSIPAVFALKDGRIVDSFVGALPEPSVVSFIKRLAVVESAADKLVAAGDEKSFLAALELEPDHPGAVVGLAEVMVGRGETEEALALLKRVPDTPEVRRVSALARLKASGEDELDVEARMESLLEKVKDDVTARREYVDLLDMLGPDDPRTPAYRKALATRIY
ncbi:MAG: putative thioredoxin [Actinomycetota bacterium]|nr:putative thioredoxin [Actinomycetota bacterium]